MKREGSEPRATRVGRLAEYLRTMFPLPLMVLFGVSSVLGVYLTLQVLAGAGPVRVGWRAATGALTFILFHMFVRVLDEFKDVESDRRMAATGDPWYTNRPLVTGRVTLDDLRVLRAGVLFTILTVNLAMGIPFPMVGCLAGCAMLWLSARYFFFPAAAGNRLWQMLFGSSIFAVIVGYVVTIFIHDFGSAGLTGWTLPLVLGQVTPLLTVETSRKFRPASQETEAETYSKIFGERIAALLPGGFALLTVLLLVPVAIAAGIGWGYPAAVALAAGLVIGAGVRFALRPVVEHAKLLPFAALFLLVSIAGLPIAVCVRHGLAP